MECKWRKEKLRQGKGRRGKGWRRKDGILNGAKRKDDSGRIKGKENRVEW